MSQNYVDDGIPENGSPDLTTIMFICIFFLLMWIAFKIAFRLIIMMLRPLFYIALLTLVWKTLQFSNNPTIIDFIFNLLSNAVALFAHSIDIALRILTGTLQ